MKVTVSIVGGVEAEEEANPKERVPVPAPEVPVLITVISLPLVAKLVPETIFKDEGCKTKVREAGILTAPDPVVVMLPVNVNPLRVLVFEITPPPEKLQELVISVEEPGPINDPAFP